jgi:hypothetical protein
MPLFWVICTRYPRCFYVARGREVPRRSSYRSVFGGGVPPTILRSKRGSSDMGKEDLGNWISTAKANISSRVFVSHYDIYSGFCFLSSVDLLINQPPLTEFSLIPRCLLDLLSLPEAQATTMVATSFSSCVSGLQISNFCASFLLLI